MNVVDIPDLWSCNFESQGHIRLKITYDKHKVNLFWYCSYFKDQWTDFQNFKGHRPGMSPSFILKKKLKIGPCWVISKNVKIEFSKCVIFWQKREISPKNKCSIFIKTGYAQLHLMVNNCVKFHTSWLNTFCNLLLTNWILKIGDF